MNLKRCALMLAVAALALTLAGSAAAKPKATVTLNLLHYVSQQPAWKVIIANFERVYPNIHINDTYVPSGTDVQLLLTQMQAGNPPDLFNSRPGRDSLTGVAALAPAGKLLNLTGAPWTSRILPSLRDPITYQKKIYAAPVTMDAYGVLYNTDLFRQLGLAIPKTMPQVLALCRKVVAAGKTPIAISMAPPNGSATVMGLQRSDQEVYAVDPQWDQKRAAGKVTFAGSPLWQRAFQSIVDMKDAGCFEQGAQGVSTTQAFTMFAKGDAVMTIMATTQLGSILAINPDLRYSFFNLPSSVTKATGIASGVSMSLAASATTADPAAVKTFINFLARPKQTSLFAKVAGSISTYDFKQGVLPAYLSSLKPLVKSGRIINSPQATWPNPSLNFGTIVPGIMGLFTGQRTVADILKAMDYMWDNPTATTAP